MEGIELGLIGYGIWGELILRDLLKLGIRVAVCDIKSSRRDQAVKAGANGSYSTVESMPKVEGLIIATPACSHASVIAALDDTGNTAPLFVEKPLTASISDTKMLLARSGAPIFVMHIWTYHAGIRKLKELLQSGIIGTPTLLYSTRANWTSPRQDVDCLSNLAPHDLSIFQYLLDRVPEPQFAIAEKIDNRIVSCIASLMDESGLPCVLNVSNRYGEKRRELRLHGDNGVLVLPNDDAGSITLIKNGGYIIPEHQQEIPYSGPSALETELSTFIDYLASKDDTLLCDVKTGIGVVKNIEKIRILTKQGEK